MTVVCRTRNTKKKLRELFTLTQKIQTQKQNHLKPPRVIIGNFFALGKLINEECCC